MPRPHTPAVIAALADIDAGMTAYAAAKKHDVAQSSLSRALKRRSNLCPCCGQPVKSSSSKSNNVLTKYEYFVSALRELCRKHEVQLAPSSYDTIDVYDLENDDDPIYLDSISDQTKKEK